MVPGDHACLAAGSICDNELSSNFLASLLVVGKTPTPLAVGIAAGQQWHIHALPPPSTLGGSRRPL